MSLKGNKSLQDKFEELKRKAKQDIETESALNIDQRKKDIKMLETAYQQELFDFLKVDYRTASHIHDYLQSSKKQNPIKTLLTSKKKKAS